MHVKVPRRGYKTVSPAELIPKNYPKLGMFLLILTVLNRDDNKGVLY